MFISIRKQHFGEVFLTEKCRNHRTFRIHLWTKMKQLKSKPFGVLLFICKERIKSMRKRSMLA